MRRTPLVVLCAAAGIALLLFLFRTPLALRAMQAGLERALTADLIGELPDGLHAVLCGAGGPLPDPQRSGPCVAVIAGESLFLVDAGSGAARNLALRRIAPGRVAAVFLTHFHSDHIDGLGEIALLRWTQGSHTTPLPVVGPRGVERVVDGFNRAYEQDKAYRVAHHGEAVVPPSGAGLRARPFAAPPDGEAPTVWEDGELRVTAFRVEHPPVQPAVGYRFDYEGRSLLVSGDTRKSANLEHFAQGVDLLVHEALADHLVAMVEQAARAAGRANLAKILSDVPEYHTTPVEAAEVAEAAGAGHLLYYHVVPPLRLPGLAGAFLEGTHEAYSGGITLGVDGTMVSLPAGSNAIEVSEL